MTIDDLLPLLGAVRRTSRGFTARCPAHDDTNPSLSICDGDRAVLVKCWAGCALSAITQAIGLKVSDLFFDVQHPRGSRPKMRAAGGKRLAIGFSFELAALDHRLRAETILKEAAIVCISGLADTALDQLLHVVSSAYLDYDRARLFESLSDDLRLKALLRKGFQHAA